MFATWLESEAASYYENCAEDVGNRAWRLFDDAISFGDDFAPGDYLRFEFNSSQAMLPHLTALESGGLIVSGIDDTDRRRRTISISPKGWFVHQARRYHSSKDE